MSEIKSNRIGSIRRALFLPFDCRWNAWVRDVTANAERLVYQLRSRAG